MGNFFSRDGMGNPSIWKTSLPQPQTSKSAHMLQSQSAMGVIPRLAQLTWLLQFCSQGGGPKSGFSLTHDPP